MPTQIPDLTNQVTFPSITSLTPTGSTALGKDEFLKLLVAQLANQDPTNPQDSSAFVAQLAQFSGLEQQQNTVSRLDTLLLGQATANETAAATFIGKGITYQGGQVQLAQGSAPTAELTLGAPAAQVTVSVSNASGSVVRTIQMGAEAAGQVAVTWDGRDDAGNLLPDGAYSLAPSAADANGAAVPIGVSTSGIVSGVSFQGGVPYLKVGDAMVKMSNVTSVSGAAASPPDASAAASAATAMQAYSQATGASP